MVRFWLACLLALGLLLCRIGGAAAEGNLSLKIIAESDHPVVGQMVLVTIRAVYDRKVANEKLEIEPSDAFDWVQIFPDDWHEERIEGLPWIVMERKLAVWPRRAGVLHFGPARHRLTVIDKESQRKDVVVEAKALPLSVGEFPALHGWHMAASAVELTDELSTDPARLQDGEVVVRRVKLRVEGVLPEHIPPRPVVSENWLITFAAPVKRELLLTEQGPVTEVEWTWQFRPHTGEPGVLEAVRIPFYNTTTRKLDAVEIPMIPIGLASFYTGQLPKGRFLPQQIALLAAAALVGLLLALGLAALRYAPDATRENWQRLRARLSPGRWFALWRASRARDYPTLRRLAEELGQSQARKQRLDTLIYARDPALHGAGSKGSSAR